MNNLKTHDFTQVADAQQFALALIENGTQFTYCPDPISISHPRLRLRQPEQTASMEERPKPTV